MVATASEEFDPKVTTPIADYDFSVLGADGWRRVTDFVHERSAR